MELAHTHDDDAFRAELRAWLAGHPPPPPPTEVGPALRDRDLAWQRSLYAAGYAGIAWPREYGGRGLSLTQQMIWYEETARAGISHVNSLFVGVSHAGPTIIADGKVVAPIGLTARAGRSVVEHVRAGARYDEMRPGMFEPAARLADLDADGVWAQVLYPSVTLAGAKTYGDDRELQRFCVRSYNEWITDFCAAGQERLFAQAIIPTTGVDDAVEKMTMMPSEVFARNFWATFMIDTAGLELRHHLNLDHVMWSTDNPHSGTDWPNSRITMDRQFRGLPLDDVRKLVHTNARTLYRIPAPAESAG